MYFWMVDRARSGGDRVVEALARGVRARMALARARARDGAWGNLMLDELSIRMDAREEGTTDARGFVWDEGWW